jgi:hypothetical protein
MPAERLAHDPIGPRGFAVARSRGWMKALAGVVATLIGLVVVVTALVERITYEPCESKEGVVCAVSVSGPVSDRIDLSPERRPALADDAMVRDLVPGAVLLILGFWLTAKGLRQMGE